MVRRPPRSPQDRSSAGSVVYKRQLNAILKLVGEGLGFAVLPPYTLSNFQKPHSFTTHRLYNPQLVCELMLVTSARRPSTETHKGVQALVADVVKQAMQDYR